MRKILIVDTNYGFTSDIEARLLLEEVSGVDIRTHNKIDDLIDVIEDAQPNELLVSAQLLSSHPSWDFGVPVKTYARDSKGIAVSNEYNLPCYGIVKNGDDLISAIENNKIVQVEQVAPQPQAQSQIQQQPPMEQPQQDMNTYNSTLNNNGYNNQNNYNNQANYNNQPQTQPYNNPRGYNSQGYEQQMPPQQAPMQVPMQNQPQNNQNPVDFIKDNRDAFLASLLAGQRGGNPPQSNPYSTNNGYQNGNGYNQNNGYNNGYNNNSYNQGGSQYPGPTNGYNNNPYNQGISQYPNNNGMNGYGNQNGYDNNPYNSNPYEQQVMRDMRMTKPKAKVISAYSAKGGVGKTTISCELATFLALTSNGRSNFKVCIADFNIDFGNVINTLDYDPKRACMSLWAADIRERLKYGENPDSINYTEPQIETFLQRKNKDGLYALLAPLTNADSMEITPVEIQVMLRNLIYNGGFDFVVCDTGNNTRDTTCIALENSDDVFMILTQSVNAANANQSFLKTMMSSNFDMSKVKTVVNMIKNEKDVGATVKEVEESILNPATGRPFECVARIKDMNAVRNSENTGEPLVYNSTHDFTREITGLAKYVIGDDFELPELPKKNLFVDLFSKYIKK